MRISGCSRPRNLPCHRAAPSPMGRSGVVWGAVDDRKGVWCRFVPACTRSSVSFMISRLGSGVKDAVPSRLPTDVEECGSCEAQTACRPHAGRSTPAQPRWHQRFSSWPVGFAQGPTKGLRALDGRVVSILVRKRSALASARAPDDPQTTQRLPRVTRTPPSPELTSWVPHESPGRTLAPPLRPHR
jgi:hypothetical protein